MTASSRPNLGGLFNGSQPPARPGRVNGAAGPKLVAAEDLSARSVATAAEATEPGVARSGSLPGWVDPVRAVEQYFALLHVLLDVNRDVAVACTRAVLSLPHRVGIRR
jgi:hypothetical protein